VREDVGVLCTVGVLVCRLSVGRDFYVKPSGPFSPSLPTDARTEQVDCLRYVARCKEEYGGALDILTQGASVLGNRP
jgi:hypothetical protein